MPSYDGGIYDAGIYDPAVSDDAVTFEWSMALVVADAERAAVALSAESSAGYAVEVARS